MKSTAGEKRIMMLSSDCFSLFRSPISPLSLSPRFGSCVCVYVWTWTSSQQSLASEKFNLLNRCKIKSG